jgi:prepilin-type N-terminal cleavage/methylation domain-containing protein
MRLLSALARRLRREESGFTLVEMLAALAIGLVVLFAVLGLLDTSIRSSAMSEGRIDSVREGRLAMDRIGQELRLASCPAVGSAIISADGSSVSYYVSAPQSDFRTDPVTERHTLTYSATDGTVTLRVFPGNGVPPVWSATASRTSRIADRLALDGGQPFFRYLRYLTSDAPATTDVPAPVAAANLPLVAQVRVTFMAQPSFGADAAGSRFDSSIVLRTDDPTDQDNSPEC